MHVTNLGVVYLPYKRDLRLKVCVEAKSITSDFLCIGYTRLTDGIAHYWCQNARFSSERLRNAFPLPE
ncbi:hypothetical protein ACTXT7_006012 [Hymenolepis weldensis]